MPKEEQPTAPQKSFKDYEPGYLHIDIKYLPQMPDEKSRGYLFVAIDRATRWVLLRVYKNQSNKSASDFLKRVKRACPFKIVKILTDNGSQFTDRFTSGRQQSSGEHVFDVLCKQCGIEHRLIKPRTPQTNGMVERFNGRISEIVHQTRFTSAAELKQTLGNHLTLYNHNIPQRALNHLTPVQALKIWQQKRPEMFVKNVYDHGGLDM